MKILRTRQVAAKTSPNTKGFICCTYTVILLSGGF
uniref:Uncharacterized protein n=1 Tax=Arundo donax TaxID=35708 RepID=A0A0A9FBF6_ARUDO